MDAIKQILATGLIIGIFLFIAKLIISAAHQGAALILQKKSNPETHKMLKTIATNNEINKEFLIVLESLNKDFNDKLITQDEYDLKSKELVMVKFNEALQLKPKEQATKKTVEINLEAVIENKEIKETTISSKNNSPSFNFSQIFIDNFNKVNPKTKKLIGFIWILFHFFMLLTSRDIFVYHISWGDFWLFDDWETYDHYILRRNNHYDISEFTLYVIIPLLIIYGRKYLKGEKIQFLKLNSSKKSNEDDLINDLKKYKELFDLGIISEDEFLAIKKKLLQ